MKIKLIEKIRLRLTVSIMLGLLTLAFVFGSSIKETGIETENSKTVNPPPASNNGDFLIAAMNDGSDYNYQYVNSELGLNLWHYYIADTVIGGNRYPNGWTYLGVPDDHLFTDVDIYKIKLGEVLSTINGNNMKAYIQRPKIEYLCFGQRSDYQCEDTSNIQDKDLWFYSFQSNHPENTHTGGDYYDNTSYGNNIWVKRCLTMPSNPDQPGYVVDRLRTNTEQSHRNIDGYAAYREDSQHEWYIKPRIRIDSTVVDNYPNTLVCKIIVIAQNGSTILKEVNIKAINFRDDNLNYGGQYIEEFYNLTENLNFHGDWGDKWTFNARGNRSFVKETTDVSTNRADIQVYWYGNCDMWIDYVRVDNDIAHNLLSTDTTNQTHQTYVKWIKDEAEVAALSSSAINFYIELNEFNQIPCMAYVNYLLDSVSTAHGKQIGLIADQFTDYQYHMSWEDRGRIMTAPQIARQYVNRIGMKQIYPGCYPFTSVESVNSTYSRIPNTLPRFTGDSILAQAIDPAEYDAWLQMQLDTVSDFFEGTGSGVNPLDNPGPCPQMPQYEGMFQWVWRLSNEISKEANVPIIGDMQAHQWFMQCGEIDREPTAEELDMTTNLAVSYGAKGMVYELYDGQLLGGINGQDYSVGFTETDRVSPRNWNMYHQPKWSHIKNMITRLKAWGPSLMSFDNAGRKSYIYRKERDALQSNTYFTDFYTYKWGSGSITCPDDFPEGDTPPGNTIGECKYVRYLQVATFNAPNARYPLHFMIVNRRCSPTNGAHKEGERFVTVKFDANHPDMTGINNWKIVEIGSEGAAPITFSKTQWNAVDLGLFMPGEGKLYNLVPVPKSGGTLVADENIEGVSFTCEDTVFSNGYNITIGANTTIHFTDTSTIVMDSGSFTMGSAEVSGSQSITSDAVNGNSWRGYSFNNCEVRIYGAAFSGLTNDTTYALNIIDCPVVDIRNSTFSTNASLKGGINGVYYSTSTIDNIYIGGNTFSSTGSTLPQVQVMSYAGITTPLIIENNTFNYGSTAILLSGVTGGAVKDNNITDYNIAINMLTSSVDIADNTIVSSYADAIGIFGASGSEIKMNNSGPERLGGANDISTTGGESNNMKVDNSYFLIDEGENIFNINETDAYHLSGFFNPFVSVTTNATENCFKFNTTPTDPPYQNVTWGDQGSPVSFTFSPYLTGCEPEGCENPVIVDLGGGIYDTICNGGGGSGGGLSSIDNKQLTINNKNKRYTGFRSTKHAFVIQTPKQMYDSLSILMRHRNYPQAKVKCYELLNTYPDSLQSIYTISKLFLATIGSDTTTNTAQQLKTYYEGLILNHPTNTALVTRANYFIQKCKVRLRDYNSALTGFSQIINQNPYSYEALVARWDYMAASLLIQGNGGGLSSINNYQLAINNEDENISDLGFRVSNFEDDSQSVLRDPNSGDDRSPYTKKERQDIRKSINTALENTGRSDERKMKILEVASSMGNVNATKELNQRKTIKKVVKTERPRTIIEHTRIVAGDIRKVFGTGNSGRNGISGNIPAVYRLSQNYPNPFNPTTKINYDLPRDAKVNIVIYDILGREVKRLLNNEIKSAGSYVVDFNASIYASGVYFYRIEAEESNGNKFVDSKKMVLLK